MTAGESLLAPTQVVMEYDTLVRLAVRRFVRHRLAITGLGGQQGAPEATATITPFANQPQEGACRSSS